MLAKGLKLDEAIVVKTMQLYESKVVRHGNMLVGNTMAGKTTCWTILADALNYLYKKEKADMEEKRVKDIHI